ncbi:helix-turn-helix transcriptional regulator [Rhizobium sp. CG5]|uniref:helix-turn-helix domain-containing protein n=1 Tax=Rhizobium sp. CG5 TaxID=2726076 RepID=UPI002033983F|nr:AraC family transcriptional regulator [Rhizobium sp. CG5]MCM2473330.1 helix-turn-helix transcriptional regulator [Rhizobium sp. CG5]
MTYLPRMNNKIDGFSVLDGYHRRYWNGMVADLWNVDCAPSAGGYYVGNDPRLFIVLDAHSTETGNFTMAEIGGPVLNGCQRRAVSFIPAGMEMRTQVHDIQYLRHLDLHFDTDALKRRIGENLDIEALRRPRFLLNEQKLMALAELIAAECSAAQPLHDLYGDGLTLALLIDVLQIAPAQNRKRTKLAGWQLRRTCDFIEEHCLRSIRLEELAELTGLSQSYFSHAFKASTGLSPHQWQMKARIARVKEHLANRTLPLTAIAAETGFADPAHFARVFRQQVGMSPSAWRRTHAL